MLVTPVRVTVAVVVAVAVPDAAVMVVVPAETPVSVPLVLIVATLGVELDQHTVSPVQLVPPESVLDPDQHQSLLYSSDLELGETVFEVYHCPGHTPGHVIFFHRGGRFAQVGDVLFAGSIGRTDFPRGNYNDLIASITGKLWPLGDDVTFVPGHNQVSTFGRERKTNPWVSDMALAQSH